MIVKLGDERQTRSYTISRSSRGSPRNVVGTEHVAIFMKSYARCRSLLGSSSKLLKKMDVLLGLSMAMVSG